MSKYVVRFNGATINVPDSSYNEDYTLLNPALDDKEYALIDPKLSLEFGSAGSLEFTLPPGHPLYDGVFNDAVWNEDTAEAQTPEYNKKLKAAQKAFRKERKKIKQWGLDTYRHDILHYKVPTVFGNIDMDKRFLITWTKKRKKKYAAALASWDYDPEIGSIDTVFGGSDRFLEGSAGLPDGVEVAFSPILQVTNGFKFISKTNLYTYINELLLDTLSAGAFTETKLLELDRTGKVIDGVRLKNMIAGADEGTRYEAGLNKAEVYGKLMHFCGYYGAIQIAQRDIDAVKAELMKEFGTMEDQMSWSRGLVTLEEDGDYVFAGRLYSYEIDMYKRKHVVFEGALNFFHDSIQPPREYDGVDMEEFIDSLLSFHNVQVYANRRIRKGHLGMANGQKIYRKTDYEDTWTCLQNYVLDTIGGYFAIRVEPMFADEDDPATYELYLDYYNQTTVIFNGKPGTAQSYTQDMHNNQVIEFQQNLLDISESFSMDDVFTRIIPLGQTEVNKGGDIDDDRSLDELALDNTWRSKYGIVLVDSVNIYKSADTSSEVVGMMSYQSRFQYVNADIEDGAADTLWFNIKFGDITGYVKWTMDRTSMNNLGASNEAVSYPHVPSRYVFGSQSWTTCVYYDGEGLLVHPHSGAVARSGPGTKYKKVTNADIRGSDGVFLKSVTTDDEGGRWFYCFLYRDSSLTDTITFFVHESGLYLPGNDVLTMYVSQYSGPGEYTGSERVPIFTGGLPGDLNQIDNRLTIASVNNGSVILTIEEARHYEEWYEEETGEFLNGDPIFSGGPTVIRYPFDTGGIPIANGTKAAKKVQKVNVQNEQKEVFVSADTASLEARFGKITRVHVFSNATTAMDLKKKGAQYLLEHARSHIEVAVSSADLSMINTSFDSFKIGQFVPIKYPGWSSRFSWNTSPVWTEDGSLLRILKLEINLDTGEKKIMIGTQKRKDLTEIVKEVDDEAKRKNKVTKVVTEAQYEEMSYKDPDTIWFVVGDV